MSAASAATTSLALRIAASNQLVGAATGGDQCFTALTTVYGVPVTLLLDTGSPVSFLCPADLERLPAASRPPLGPPPPANTELGGIAAGVLYTIIGTVTLPVNVVAGIQPVDQPLPFTHHGELTVTFSVIEGGATSLLGMDVLHSAEPNIFSVLLRHHLDRANVDYRLALGARVPIVAPPALDHPTTVTFEDVLHPVPGDPSDGGDDYGHAAAAPATLDDMRSWTEADVGDFSAESQQKVLDFMWRNRALWGPLPKRADSPMPFIHIPYPGGARIKTGLYRKCPPKYVGPAMQKFEKLLADGVLEIVPDDSTLTHVHPHVYIIKPDGTCRVTVDLSALNAQLPRHKTVLPRMDSFLDAFHGCEAFSDVDVRDFFFSFRVTEATANLFGCRLPDGRFARYVSMPQGLHDSPGRCQGAYHTHVVTPVMAQLDPQAHTLGAYVDNNALGTRPARPGVPEAELVDAHLRALQLLFDRLYAAGLRLKPNGSRLLRRECRALGYITDGTTVRLDPDRLQGWSTMEPPSTIGIAYVRHARGLFNHYAASVGTLEYQNNLAVLTDIIVTAERTGQLAGHLWAERGGTAAFYALRDAVSAAAARYLPDFSKPFVAWTDACDTGFAYVVGQYDHLGVLRPCFITAHRWDATQRRYDTKVQECFAIVELLRRLGWLAAIADLTVRVDHRNLLFLQQATDRTLARWYRELCSHPVTFQFTSGDANLADQPSRLASDVYPHALPLPALRVVCAAVALPATTTDAAWRFDVGDSVEYKGATVPYRVAARCIADDGSRQYELTETPDPGRPLAARPQWPTMALESEVQPWPATRQRRRGPATVMFADAPTARQPNPRPARAPAPDAPAPPLPSPTVAPDVASAAPMALDSASTATIPALPGIPRTAPITMARLRAAQPLFSEAELTRLRSDKRYSVVDGLWRAGSRFVIPVAAKDIIADILWQAHAASVHGGINDLLHRVRLFTWTRMTESASALVASCPVCQIIDAPAARVSAAPERPLQGNLHPIVPSAPFSLVIVDHVPMPISARGNTAILTITDAFTRWTEAAAVKDMTPATTLAAFIDAFYHRHDLPRRIQADNHPAFGGAFKAWLEERGVEFHPIHAYHPQANGKAERPHATLQAKLRAYTLGPNTARWDDALPAAAHAERTRVNRVSGLSAYNMLLGFQPATPFETLLDTPPACCTISEWQALLTYVHSYVDTANNIAAAEQKRIFDATRANTVNFKTGDKVMLFTPSEAANKLIPPWTAGYVVTDVTRAPDFYSVARLELDGTTASSIEVPISRLLPFNTLHAPDGGASLQTKPDHHLVTGIEAHLEDDNGLSFHVRWSDGSVSEAYLPDLVKHCRIMLEQYAAAHGIPWSRIRAAAAALRSTG